jgi:hypothetical protein
MFRNGKTKILSDPFPGMPFSPSAVWRSDAIPQVSLDVPWSSNGCLTNKMSWVLFIFTKLAYIALNDVLFSIWESNKPYTGYMTHTRILRVTYAPDWRESDANVVRERATRDVTFAPLLCIIIHPWYYVQSAMTIAKAIHSKNWSAKSATFSTKVHEWGLALQFLECTNGNA